MSESKNKFALSAVRLRNIFIGLFILLLLLGVALGIFGIKSLQTTADNVQVVVAEANVVDQTNSRTVTLWNELQDKQRAVTRVKQVVAESKSYAYQDVIVRDLKTFAKKADITITNYDFTVEGSSAASSASSAPQAPSPSPTTDPAGAAGGEQPAAGASTPVASTLKTTSVAVTIETPVDYQKLLRFIHYIEQSLTNMQISQVSLSRATSDNKNAVTSDALTIEVYIQ